jgi:hypothetical protein
MAAVEGGGGCWLASTGSDFEGGLTVLTVINSEEGGWVRRRRGFLSPEYLVYIATTIEPGTLFSERKVFQALHQT